MEDIEFQIGDLIQFEGDDRYFVLFQEWIDKSGFYYREITYTDHYRITINSAYSGAVMKSLIKTNEELFNYHIDRVSKIYRHTDQQDGYSDYIGHIEYMFHFNEFENYCIFSLK